MNCKKKGKENLFDKAVQSELKKGKGKVQFTLNVNDDSNRMFLAYRKSFIFIGIKGSPLGSAFFMRADSREELCRAEIRINNGAINVVNKPEDRKIDFTKLITQPSNEDLKKMLKKKFTN